MKLLTKAIESALTKAPLYSQEGKGEEAKVVVKYFLGSWTWLVTEGEKEEDGDYLFFGLVVNQEGEEWGYFRLSDLQSIRVMGCLSVEREMYGPAPLKQTIKQYLN